MRLLIKLLPIIFTTLMIGSCSQYRKVSCPVYDNNFYTQKKGHEQYKKYKFRKSINTAYKSFYKTKNDKTTKNQSSKNNHSTKSDNSVVNRINDLHDSVSAKADNYASNANSLSLKNSLVHGINDPVPTIFGKPDKIVNKHPSRKEFKRDLVREIKKIKSEFGDPANDPGIKYAKQSLLFGLISLGSFLLLFIPYVQYFALLGIILFSILAIAKGQTALNILDKANYKFISKAHTGKTLGTVALILLGVGLIISIIFLFILLLAFSQQ